MNLAAMLAAHDDAVLEALASKGLVRRAQRDLEAGAARIDTQTATEATLTADGQTVQIDGRGPTAARCTCPAYGICRHVVLAVMALRAARASESEPPAPGDQRSAEAEVCAMTQAELVKFAGSDWSAALALADQSKEAATVSTGLNCTVELAAPSVSVTFIAGQSLKKAVYKGVKTRARVVTAAAAIVLRARKGIAIEGGDASMPAEELPITADFLAGVRAVLLRATRIVLTAPSPLAVDMLFDVAISARADAAPRLAAQLRALARQAGLATRRDVNFEASRFLADAARTLALVDALARDPADPALTGSLRREYRPGPPLDLWLMGASRWHSETGARGLTFYSFAPAERCWHTTTIARAAGQDPGFDPGLAYTLPLWGAGQPRALMGSALHLPEPMIASDRSIAVTQPKAARRSGDFGGLRALPDAGAAHLEWSALRRDLSNRLAGGLKRSAMPSPVLLLPARFGGLAFDEIAQAYEWEVIDRNADTLSLSIPAEHGELAERLRRESRQIRMLLAEASVTHDGLVLRPVSIYVENAGTFAVINLLLDDWKHPGKLHSAILSALDAVTGAKAPATMIDPIHALATRALDATAVAVSSAASVDLGEMVGACESAGLLSLGDALQRVIARRDIEEAMRAAYVAAEVRVVGTLV